MIKHYSTCRANYPEKPEGEPAQATVQIDLDDHQFVNQCVDCGAFEICAKDDGEPPEYDGEPPLSFEERMEKVSPR